MTLLKAPKLSGTLQRQVNHLSADMKRTSTALCSHRSLPQTERNVSNTPSFIFTNFIEVNPSQQSHSQFRQLGDSTYAIQRDYREICSLV